jgi:hypothetical protein
MGTHKDVVPCGTDSARSPGWIAASECLKQGLGVLHVRRVKPLGKPLVYRRQQIVGVLTLALGLPEASQAGGDA